MKRPVQFGVHFMLMSMTFCAFGVNAQGGLIQIDENGDTGVPSLSVQGDATLLSVNAHVGQIGFTIMSIGFTNQFGIYYLDIYEPDHSAISDRFFWYPLPQTRMMGFELTSAPYLVDPPPSAIHLFLFDRVESVDDFTTVFQFVGGGAHDIYQVRVGHAPDMAEPASVWTCGIGTVFGLGWWWSRRSRRAA
jgi:hypothetical protein